MKTLTDKEKIELNAKLEVYKRVLVKAGDIKAGRITSIYFESEIEREIKLIEEQLREPVSKPEKIEMIIPEYGPGDTVRHTITDTPMQFTVMEVIHKTQQYKLTSKNQIKPVTVLVGWGEVDSN